MLSVGNVGPWELQTKRGEKNQQNNVNRTQHIHSLIIIGSVFQAPARWSSHSKKVGPFSVEFA